MPSTAVIEAVRRLASRDATRTEADLQADIYLLLTSGGLALDADQVVRLEAQVGDGTRRRLDVAVGHCVIEVKKDLRPAGIRADAETQLAGYVATQTAQLQSRYVGVLTDGTQWLLYRLDGNALVEVAHLTLSGAEGDPDRLLVWLEAILATREQVAPTPLEVDRRLGAGSPVHLLDHATLRALFDESLADPEVALKRQLWAKLLRTAFGTAFTDDTRLFIDHTLLVLTAEIIAHAVVGFDVSPAGGLSAATLARGGEFINAQIYGVVEADFFDWVVEVPGGEAFIGDLARRIARFDWSHVEHDVLKVLYESVISSEDRASLGEYYTADWLADRVVDHAVPEPLTQRVLDPACGSGTFLFHAARRYLDAAASTDMTLGDTVSGLTSHVLGLDVHPVAVTLARVTYLLAIGRARLADEHRGPLTVPVYLGDSVQWDQRADLLADTNAITINTAGDDLVDAGGGTLFGDDLVFPRSVLDDAGVFDRLVSAMAERATQPSTAPSRDRVRPILTRFGIHADDVNVLTATFDTMRRLHDTKRNHIWSYYVRNLIRPIWLAEPANHVDVLVGNPPWLAYSKMTGSMQSRYSTICRDRGLITARLGVSGRDLSTLFAARAVELYLRPGGRFALVMPHGTMSRRPAEGFRSGSWHVVGVSFEDSWDLAAVTTGFPFPACVVHGTRVGTGSASAMPAQTLAWMGTLPRADMSWPQAAQRISTSVGSITAVGGPARPESPYKTRFRQGAILVPRVLCFVEDDTSSPLGAGAGRVSVRSFRSTLEKAPWKDVASLSGVVERRFVHAVHLGENVLPFRTTEPRRAVVPIAADLLTRAQIDEQAALAQWWSHVEEAWEANKKPSDDSTFLERIDFHGQLSSQAGGASHRVVYTKAGNRIAAARLDPAQSASLIDHKLYWAACSSADEGRYLAAILNSKVLLDRVAPLQAVGLFGPRDVDKAVFAVPFPTYSAGDPAHAAVVAVAAEAEAHAAAVILTGAGTFQQRRTLVRDSLMGSGITGRLETAVGAVVPPVVV